LYIILQAKAPGSPILIVGTFINNFQCDLLRSQFLEYFASPSSSLQVDVAFVECNSRRKRPCNA